jgi:hypothetical protein
MLDRTALETQHAASVKVHLLYDGVGDTFGLVGATSERRLPQLDWRDF